MKLIVDRIEGDILVAELPDGSLVNIPASICEGAREGNIIEVRILEKETSDRDKEIKQKMQKLFR